MLVFAFDRDWTVDVNPHPDHEAVPLEWVRHLAHETPHAVYAIGDQALAEEAAIPGVVDVVGRHPDDWERWLGGKQPDGRYERFPLRGERLSLIADLHPDADGYVVVDDLDLSGVDGWAHYHAWEFVLAVERGEIDPDLPWVREPVADGGLAPSAEIVPVDSSMLSSFLDDDEDAPGFELGYTAEGTERTRLLQDVSLVDSTLARPAAAPAIQWTPISQTPAISPLVREVLEADRTRSSASAARCPRPFEIRAAAHRDLHSLSAVPDRLPGGNPVP